MGRRRIYRDVADNKNLHSNIALVIMIIYCCFVETVTLAKMNESKIHHPYTLKLIINGLKVHKIFFISDEIQKKDDAKSNVNLYLSHLFDSV